MIRKAGFSFLPETTKKVNYIYKTLVFKILNTKQQRIVISEKWEINEVSLMIAPAYYLRVSCLREGEPKKNLVNTVSRE